jgi:hypothetical protein
MKPNDRLASRAADRFRTVHWIGVLVTAQMPGSPVALANLRWLGP